LGLPTTGSLSNLVTHRPKRWLTWTAVGSVVLAAGGAVGFLAWHKGSPLPGPQPGQIDQLTDFEGSETSPSLAPDGTFFVYAKSVDGKSNLFFKRVAGGD